MKTLTIDIGNTNLSFGLFLKNRLTFKFDIPTQDIKEHGGISKEFIEKLHSENPDNAIACSVVPEIDCIIKENLQKIGINLSFTGKEIKIPVDNLYEKPEQVGQDRLVNAFSVNKFYKVPAIIVDYGTAVTFDYVNENGQYEGGLIFPGIKTSLSALITKAALLPDIEIKKTDKSLIGKDTESSMIKGVINGFIYMSQGIIESFKKQTEKQLFIIATGGDIDLIEPYINNIEKFDRDLTLKGLKMLSNY